MNNLNYGKDDRNPAGARPEPRADEIGVAGGQPHSFAPHPIFCLHTHPCSVIFAVSIAR